jgi:hypothetical protein
MKPRKSKNDQNQASKSDSKYGEEEEIEEQRGQDLEEGSGLGVSEEEEEFDDEDEDEEEEEKEKETEEEEDEEEGGEEEEDLEDEEGEDEEEEEVVVQMPANAKAFDFDTILKAIAKIDELAVESSFYDTSILWTIIDKMSEIRKTCNPDIYQDIAEAITDLTTDYTFLTALRELSRVSEFIFFIHHSYAVKLNPDSSDEKDLLLLDTIRTAFRKFMNRVTNREKNALTLLN